MLKEIGFSAEFGDKEDGSISPMSSFGIETVGFCVAVPPILALNLPVYISAPLYGIIE